MLGQRYAIAEDFTMWHDATWSEAGTQQALSDIECIGVVVEVSFLTKSSEDSLEGYCAR